MTNIATTQHSYNFITNKLITSSRYILCCSYSYSIIQLKSGQYTHDYAPLPHVMFNAIKGLESSLPYMHAFISNR